MTRATLGMTRLDSNLASKFAGLALAHVTREYPNKLDHVINGPGNLRSPRGRPPPRSRPPSNSRRPRAGACAARVPEQARSCDQRAGQSAVAARAPPAVL